MKLRQYCVNVCVWADRGRVFEIWASTENSPCTVDLVNNRFHRHLVFLYLVLAVSYE